MVLMGATSIVGGTLVGVLAFGNKLGPTEVSLLGLILAMLFYRAV